MIKWRYDIENAHKDGRAILIFTDLDEFATVYWSDELYFGKPFGWTHDGGDNFDPVAWAELDRPNPGL